MPANDTVTELSKHFPAITKNNTAPTSPETDDYNCIAWAYGRKDKWFWPDEYGLFYWPLTNREETMDCFIALFSSIGYEQCDDSAYEKGFRKIAIYGINGLPTHAARQLAGGKWTSKLGASYDIEHDNLEVLEGKTYGKVCVIMRKKVGKV
jgi:hypothetical protein